MKDSRRFDGNKVYTKHEYCSFEKLMKRLSFINLKLLRSDKNLFYGDLRQHSLTVRQSHLFSAKKRIKEIILNRF